MSSRFKPFTTLVLLALSTSIYSQNLRFEHLTVKQGLSQNNIWDVIQDKYGFIWIATEDGVNQYDGYSFKIFRANSDDSASISSNNVRALAEDSVGNIYLGTENGLNIYNRKFDRIERYVHDPNDPNSLSSNAITCLLYDSRGALWIGTGGGLDKFDPKGHTFEHYSNSPSNPGSFLGGAINCLMEDDRRVVWIGTNNGLSSLYVEKGVFKNFPINEDDPSALHGTRINSMIEDKDEGMLWLGTFSAGVARFNPRTGFAEYYGNIPENKESLSNNYVRDLQVGPDGQLWVGTDNGLNLFNRQNKKCVRYSYEAENEFSLTSNIVSDIFFDMNNNMWISTRYGGTNIYDKERFGFDLFKHNPLDQQSLSSNNVLSFSEDEKGNIWIATDGGGANYWNRKTGQFTKLTHNPNDNNSLSTDKVIALEYDSHGRLWIGTWAGGLNVYDPQTGIIKHYFSDPLNPKSVSDNNIFNIMEDSHGNIWIGTWGNGISRYNYDTDDFTRFVNDPNNPRSFQQSPVVYLEEDHLGKIWVATETMGLQVFDPNNFEGFTIFMPGGKGEISGNAIFTILEDRKNRLWIGTNGAGLNLFDPETKKFTYYQRKDGLPNDGVMGILEDDKNNLWISTNDGLCKFNPDSLTYRIYTESDGLQSNQFTRWSFEKLNTGELLFGGSSGFNLFNPARLTENKFIPPVYIVDFKLFNKTVSIGKDKILKSNILDTNEIILNHTDNMLSFEFVALNFRQTDKNRYKYKLEGFQDEWVDAGIERKVNYTNLDPGEYIFRVIGSNNDGIWNTEGAALKIIIIPPIWRRSWFITITSFFLLFSIWYVIRYQRKKVKRQKAELQAIIEEQTQEVKKQNEEIIKKSEQERILNWTNEGLAFFGEIISKNKGSMEDLSFEVLSHLAKYVNALQGTLAMLNNENPEDPHLIITATYGVNNRRLNTNRIELDEGLIGSCFQDKEKRYLVNLPEKYIQIESGLGQLAPSKLFLQPLKTEDGEMHGVIELAFFQEVSIVTQNFLAKVGAVIALNMQAAMLNHKTKILLQNSKEQTEALQSQEEEMRQNMEELEATQEELKRREKEYQQQIDDLHEELNKLRKNR